jgi:sulfide:quinone oxidoreductase
VHRVPAVVVESGLAADVFGWVPVNKKTLETNFPGVYAVGDVNGVGTPKAGVFAEGAARVVATAIISQLRGGPSPEAYDGAGSCYVEFGNDQVGRVDVNFLSGPKPTGIFQEPSEALAAEKVLFGSSRLQRWFGSKPHA